VTFLIWYRWLIIASAGFAMFGVVIAVLPDTAVLSMWNAAAGSALYDGAIPRDAEAMKAFLFGPLGATITGFYVMQLFIVCGPFRRREPWAWHAIAAATLAWFVIDSACSLYHGALFNVLMINVPALAAIALPLAGTFPAMGRVHSPGEPDHETRL
jgi:hypothetical protein